MLGCSVSPDTGWQTVPSWWNATTQNFQAWVLHSFDGLDSSGELKVVAGYVSSDYLESYMIEVSSNYLTRNHSSNPSQEASEQRYQKSEVSIYVSTTKSFICIKYFFPFEALFGRITFQSKRYKYRILDGNSISGCGIYKTSVLYLWIAVLDHCLNLSILI